MLSFVAGIVAGGMAAYYCRDEISGYLNRRLPPVREQLANAVHTVQEGSERGPDQVRHRAQLEAAQRRAVSAGHQPHGLGWRSVRRESP